MDITLIPDTYMPSLDENGNYIDRIPIIKNGMYCLCGSRKDKTYDNAIKFSTHIKSKTHQKWISSLNKNKVNHYVELSEIKELVEVQKTIIARLEKQLQTKSLTIDYLTEKLMFKSTTSDVDLLSIN